jgi:hypothetical protein
MKKLLKNPLTFGRKFDTMIMVRGESASTEWGRPEATGFETHKKIFKTY